MRYQVRKHHNRYKVVDTLYDEITICHTGSRTHAIRLALDLSKRFGDAPRPIALEEYQKRQEAA